MAALALFLADDLVYIHGHRQGRDESAVSGVALLGPSALPGARHSGRGGAGLRRDGDRHRAHRGPGHRRRTGRGLRRPLPRRVRPRRGRLAPRRLADHSPAGVECNQTLRGSPAARRLHGPPFRRSSRAPPPGVRRPGRRGRGAPRLPPLRRAPRRAADRAARRRRRAGGRDRPPGAGGPAGPAAPPGRPHLRAGAQRHRPAAGRELRLAGPAGGPRERAGDRQRHADRGGERGPGHDQEPGGDVPDPAGRWRRSPAGADRRLPAPAVRGARALGPPRPAGGGRPGAGRRLALGHRRRQAQAAEGAAHDDAAAARPGDLGGVGHPPQLRQPRQPGAARRRPRQQRLRQQPDPGDDRAGAGLADRSHGGGRGLRRSAMGGAQPGGCRPAAAVESQSSGSHDQPAADGRPDDLRHRRPDAQGRLPRREPRAAGELHRFGGLRHGLHADPRAGAHPGLRARPRVRLAAVARPLPARLRSLRGRALPHDHVLPGRLHCRAARPSRTSRTRRSGSTARRRGSPAGATTAR